MPKPPSSLLSADDYDAIESAVLETNRGRWFLAEYARRNRQADTEMLLGAIERLEGVMRTESVTSVARVRAGLVDMAEAIARTKSDIATLRPEGGHGRIEEATEELDSVVIATETATSEILVAAEQVQEIAWTMREQGLDQGHCDALDARATDIYTSCSFQDLTGQRTRKVIQVLRYLEGRIGAMIDVWGGRPQTMATADDTCENALPDGSPRRGCGLDQADVDMVMEPVFLPLEPESVSPAFQMTARPDWEVPEPTSRPAVRPPADPLAPLAAMSYEEKVALFT